MTNKRAQITKSDITKTFWRTLFALQMGWNYEKMQGLGYCFAIMPVLRKLYPEKQELSDAIKTHLGFFNTTPAMANIIVGTNIALEEQFGQSDKDGIIGLKAGLMGPFAGIGDTVFVAIYRAIVFSIAASLALQGNPIGLFLVVLCAVGIWYVRYLFTHIGYKQGQRVATGFASSLRDLTEAASILGLTVIGAMVPTTVTANFTNINFTMGFANVIEAAEGVETDIVRNLQNDLLNKIMPFLVPLGIVFLAYWLLGKKSVTTTKLIIYLFILGFVLGNLANLVNGTWSY